MRRFAITIAALLLWSGACGLPRAAATPPDTAASRQKELESAARRSFRRLQQDIKRNGFYNARAALNIWRCDAIEAGTFDAALFEQIKRELYQSSIEKNRACFNEYLLRKSFRDAKMCLEIWRLHAQEIGVFDASRYAEMRKQLQMAIAKARSGAAGKKATALKSRPKSVKKSTAADHPPNP